MLQKDNMDEFLSWAFFGVHYSTIQSSSDMLKALNEFYQTLESEACLTFEPGKNVNFTPRCFTFEKVNSLYRPYCVYAGVALMRMAANIILTIIGFQQYTCERGMRYWHRAAKSYPNESPFLFFHGIAPGGHAPYLPMIFLGLLREDSSRRDIFFFENKPVSYLMCFDAVSEEDSVHGILEAVNRHLGSKSTRNLTLCGHSLGSCQLTLMVKSPHLRDRIQTLILIDPVSILLSEPDVMINFLYTRRESEELEDKSNSWARKLIRFFHESKIHLVASSELFIENYLRRNFAWYNSELWLADIPNECKVLVCLSEHDEIVNSTKVDREISEHNNLVRSQKINSVGPVIEKLMWKSVGHAHCITHPDRWMDIRDAICKLKQ
jgi:pimeloyl-ACP methyl ester carboxylesterase